MAVDAMMALAPSYLGWLELYALSRGVLRRTNLVRVFTAANSNSFK